MSIFQDYFTNFTTFRFICFFIAVFAILILMFTWPALAASYGTNSPAVWYTVGGLAGAIVLGLAGATIPFLTRNKYYQSL